jgi:hypothetical protein
LRRHTNRWHEWSSPRYPARDGATSLHARRHCYVFWRKTVELHGTIYGQDVRPLLIDPRTAASWIRNSIGRRACAAGRSAWVSAKRIQFVSGLTGRSTRHGREELLVTWAKSGKGAPTLAIQCDRRTTVRIRLTPNRMSVLSTVVMMQMTGMTPETVVKLQTLKDEWNATQADGVH